MLEEVDQRAELAIRGSSPTPLFLECTLGSQFLQWKAVLIALRESCIETI